MIANFCMTQLLLRKLKWISLLGARLFKNTPSTINEQIKGCMVLKSPLPLSLDFLISKKLSYSTFNGSSVISDSTVSFLRSSRVMQSIYTKKDKYEGNNVILIMKQSLVSSNTIKETINIEKIFFTFQYNFP